MADEFYTEAITQLLQQGKLSSSSRILVVAGGENDACVMRNAGLRDVTISNLDTRMHGTEYAPFAWSRQDAEALDFADDTFDWVVVHNGLHHCFSPHKALLEMYRVARRGVLLFEPYDNLMTRVGVRLGFGQDFEHAAVYYNDLAHGGVANTKIPNFIYRWTSAEIEKTINCNAPYGPHRIDFIHKMRVPWEQLRGRRNKIFHLLVVAGYPLLKAVERVFPAQCNCFAAVIEKLDDESELHPWLKRGDRGEATLHTEWLEQRYQKLPPGDDE